MLDPRSIDAVVFDIGGVFSIPHHEVVARSLIEHGFVVSTDPVTYHRAHSVAVHRLASVHPADEDDPAFWHHYRLAYLAEVGVPPDQLDAAADAFERLFAEAVAGIWTWPLTANIDGFRRLAEAGMPLAVVSNNDGTAADQLVALSVCQVGPGALPSVACIVDSASVGVRKPDPRIFEPALRALGVMAERALYVGDMVHADVRGAEAAGMQVVQLDPFDLHLDFTHHRVPDVGVLADLLLGTD